MSLGTSWIAKWKVGTKGEILVTYIRPNTSVVELWKQSFCSLEVCVTVGARISCRSRVRKFCKANWTNTSKSHAQKLYHPLSQVYSPEANRPVWPHDRRTSSYHIKWTRRSDPFHHISGSFLTIMSGRVDEETPLLAGSGKRQATPLPWFQLLLVFFSQLLEPLTSNVIYPFAPEVCSLFFPGRLINWLLWMPKLIRDIGITHGNESKVGYYVGLIVGWLTLYKNCS